MRILVLGPISKADRIKQVAEEYMEMGEGNIVDYVKPESDKTLMELVEDIYDRISKADLVIALSKESGELGESVTYEVAYANRIGKMVIVYEEVN